MKKFFYVFVACAMMTLASCGGSNKPAEAPAATDNNTEAAAENIDEAALALAGAYDGVAEEIAKVESKEDLMAICMALNETLKELDKEYPNYQPDAETGKAIIEASTAVGEAIGTVGEALGMSADEIQECQNLVTAE